MCVVCEREGGKKVDLWVWELEVCELRLYSTSTDQFSKVI